MAFLSLPDIEALRCKGLVLNSANFIRLFKFVCDLGEDVVNIEDSYISGVTLQGDNLVFTGEGSAFNGSVDLSGLAGDASTGLEAFQGGWRIVGSTTTDRYVIGANSMDLTIYDPGFIGFPDTHPAPYGAQSSGSLLWGINNKDEGDFENVTLGSINRTNAFAYSSIIGGYNSVGFGYGDSVLGTYNTINPGDVNSFLFAIGHNNTVNSRFGGGALGLALIVNGDGEVAVGKANNPWAGADNAADRYAFVVGTGTTTTPAGRWQPVVQKNAFFARFNDQLGAPAYGSGTFSGTATFALAVDADGNIIEIPLGGSTPNLQQVTDQGATTTNNITIDNGSNNGRITFGTTDTAFIDWNDFPADGFFTLSSNGVFNVIGVNSTKLMIMDGNGFGINTQNLSTTNRAFLRTNNITNQRLLELPDSNGILINTINGNAPDAAGNAVVPTFDPRTVDTATLGATFNSTINATDHRNKWLVTNQQDAVSGILQLNGAGVGGFTPGDEIILVNNGTGQVRVVAIGVTVITPVQVGPTFTFQEGERVSIVIIDGTTVSYHVTTT